MKHHTQDQKLLEWHLYERARRGQVRRAMKTAPTRADRKLSEAASGTFEEFQRFLRNPPDMVLRAIIKVAERPALLVRDNTFEVDEEDYWFNKLEPYRAGLEASLPCVGRIELAGHPDFAWIGTGFLVAEGVLATNRHVAIHFVERDGQGFRWRKSLSGAEIHARIDFREEYQTSQSEEHAITDVAYLEPTEEGLDLALLRVDTSNLTARSLGLKTGAEAEDLVVTVGYPWLDTRQEPALVELAREALGDIFDVKRMAPGVLIEASAERLSHDCTTLRGNSGSAVLDVESGNVVGLHYGDGADANLAVTATVLENRLGQV